MAYGIEIRNASDAIVMDADFPCVYLDGSPTTVSGTYVAANLYKYTTAQLGYFPFIRLDVGVKIGRGLPTGSAGAVLPDYFSTASSLTVQKCLPITDVTLPTGGYGMASYDASGNVTFHSGVELMPIRHVVGCTDGDTLPLTLASSSHEWVYFTGGALFVQPIQPPIYAVLATVISRPNSTTIETSTQTIAITDSPWAGPSQSFRLMVGG